MLVLVGAEIGFISLGIIRTHLDSAGVDLLLTNPSSIAWIFLFFSQRYDALLAASYR